jgi:tetratricopeptide (TPR) repeat protein
VFGQDLKTYSGEMSDAILDKGKANYTYYEKDGEIIRHGKFSYTWKDIQSIPVRNKKVNVSLIKTIRGTYKDGLKDGKWTYSVKYTDYALGHAHVGDYSVSSANTYSSGSINMASSYSSGVPHGSWSFVQTFKTRYSIPVGYYTWKWSSYSKLTTRSLKTSFSNGTLKGDFIYNDPYNNESAKFTFDSEGFITGEGKYDNLGNVTSLTFQDRMLVKEVQREMSTAKMEIKTDFTDELNDPNFEYKKDSVSISAYLDGKMNLFRTNRYFNYKVSHGRDALIGGDYFKNYEIKGGAYYRVDMCRPFDKSYSTGWVKSSKHGWGWAGGTDYYSIAQKAVQNKKYDLALKNYNIVKGYLGEDSWVCKDERAKYLIKMDSLIEVTLAWKDYAVYTSLVNYGDQLFEGRHFDAAIKTYTEAIEKYPHEAYPKEKLEEVKAAKEVARKEKIIVGIDQQIPPLKEHLLKHFGKSNKYPIGKNVYEKGMQLATSSNDKYLAAQTLDQKIELGNFTISILEKLLMLKGTDTKDINKQLKKAETDEDIKRILGL